MTANETKDRAEKARQIVLDALIKIQEEIPEFDEDLALTAVKAVIDRAQEERIEDRLKALEIRVDRLAMANLRVE